MDGWESELLKIESFLSVSKGKKRERERERKDGNYLGARGGRANWTGEELATR